ncbi:hypothetical protein [Undibacterium sp. Ji22W]|uniref:hypothetical protein n=1 Tax=Undibacterium sp. Ji22W TaxID=3413038 RepID=UPI003BF2D5F0
MSGLRSKSIQKWWPATQALDLVEGDCDVVAKAVHAEVSRFCGKEVVDGDWEIFPNLDGAFGAANEFANVPTFYLVIPTFSKWVVLWNNSFLCDGYDSLCHCLTINHALTTLHWSAHDEWTSMQSGAVFSYRYVKDGDVFERTVQAAQQDRKWLFFESGKPLVEEDVQLYKTRIKRDRLNEERVSQLLARLGASPWSEEFYDFSKPIFVIRRRMKPPTIITRNRKDVLTKG